MQVRKKQSVKLEKFLELKKYSITNFHSLCKITIVYMSAQTFEVGLFLSISSSVKM